MFKYFVLLALVLCCTYSIHMQTYAPSTPGGYYYGTNSTGSNTYPANTNYGSTSTNGIYINGVPYIYTGPFTLVCYYPANTNTVYRYDSCYDINTCGALLNEYKKCNGTVKRYTN